MIIVLAGATAVGKSELALALARRLGATILVADSMQVYKDMDIGTAKPTREEQAEILHGGLNLATPEQRFSVADYLKAAAEHFRHFSHRALIICGGSGLYLRALREGIAEVPPIPCEILNKLQTLSLQELQALIQTTDSKVAKKIDIKNPRRLIRALAVKMATGRSILEWQMQQHSSLLSDKKAHYFWIRRNEKEEIERIQNRIEEMFKKGWLEEVRQLLKKYAPEKILNHAAIGYGQIANFLQDESSQKPDLQKLKENIFTETRQYRKRQYTWFKKELCWQILNVSGLTTDTLADKILQMTTRSAD
ncbi:MAG: tRNA (adenosine(37)-N6)-dimethylallyltransferase MiaA [Methylacidiphilales bacterium]|nr:tRNA (adenosine(37)-N6)-dimethylallyltransferase MiaA [Candidatus Methylacidiphilales bacterium]MDW8348746.1 tRNA (adenosine(37)-N6)-dimethylallyltransferase MiaA [Verrucomicrobiae bacterium]